MCAQLLYLHFRKLPLHDRRFRLATTQQTVVARVASVFCAALSMEFRTTCTTSTSPVFAVTPGRAF
jgi:hypothetical protein